MGKALWMFSKFCLSRLSTACAYEFMILSEMTLFCCIGGQLRQFPSCFDPLYDFVRLRAKLFIFCLDMNENHY